MRKDSKNQLTLNFEAGLSDIYGSGRELIQARVHSQGRPQKAIAGDMDLSPSHLSRKLAQAPTDSARFTLDEAERFMDVTGDLSLIEYFVDKYYSKAAIKKIDDLEAEIARLKQSREIGRVA